MTMKYNQLFPSFHTSALLVPAFVLALALAFANLAQAQPSADPAGVVTREVPRSSVPEEVQNLVEQHVELTGELEAIYEDHEDGSYELLHFLKANGRRYALDIDTMPSWVTLGMSLRVSGTIRHNVSVPGNGESSSVPVVSPDEDGIQYLAADGTSGTTSVTGTSVNQLSHTTGEQRTLVLLVNFLDTASAFPFSLSRAYDVVFGTVSNFYLEASYGKTWLAGDVRGWYTLPINSTCDTSAVSDAADSMATADGVDLSLYDRFLYVMKGNAGCFWTGASDVGKLPSRSFTNGNIDPMVIAHELGHALGLSHSGFLDCGDTVLGTDCTKTQDDKFDTMGAAPQPAHFNAFQKDRLGWYEPGDVLNVTASGTYTLLPLETQDGSQPKVLKIQGGVDPVTGGASSYYLEYRQALGTDTFLADNWNVTHGVLVHTVWDSNANVSWLLDTTPASESLTFYDRSDPALTVGQNFTDSAANITITTITADQDGATVDIAMGQASCSTLVPLLSVTPASLDAAAGTTVDYVLTITNQDTATCPKSTFALDYDVPAGWTGSLSQTSLELMPGETGSITNSVTSASDAAAGTYQAIIMVSDPDEATHAGTAAAAYNVVEACTAVTPSLSLSPATQSGDPGATLLYAVTLVNNDSATCDTTAFDLTITSLPAGWIGDLSTTSMNLSPGTTATATFSVTSPAATTASSYNLQIAASGALDPEHAKSAAAAYVVNDTATVDDTQAPAAPTGVVASETGSAVKLSWNASTDNVGVAGYQVWRDGAIIADTANTAYDDRSLTDNTLHEYIVEAYDLANNVSAPSDSVMAGKAKGKAKGAGGGNGKGNQ